MPELDLIPVLDQIVVTLVEEKLASGLHLVTDTAPTGPKYARVVAVGPGRPSEYSGGAIMYPAPDLPEMPSLPLRPRPNVAHPGQTILFHGGAGTKVTRNGVEYRFIRPADVLAVAP